MAYIEKEPLCAWLENLGVSDYIINTIKDENHFPTAKVEKVKYGKWLPQILLGQKVWDCSECKTLGSPHWKRCPICEAKMDEGKE